MSTEGSDFVRRWVDENITVDWYRRDDDEGASRLAGKCASDAVAMGIEIIEIQEEIGSIETVIREALEGIAAPRRLVTSNLDQEARDA